MYHNLTIVSAFVTGVNKNPTKTIDTYLQHGRQLMRVKIPKIIFIDETLIDKLMDETIDPDYNRLVPYHLQDIYLYQYRERLKNVKVFTDNPEKDTLEYFMVQCNKTEWIRQAIEMDAYHSEHYMWIDFGIYQFIDVLQLSLEEKFTTFAQSLYQIEYQKNPLVRIPRIWDLKSHRSLEYLRRHICWYFAGSIFGGGKGSLIQFADLMRNECLKLVTQQSWLMWEVNIWYLIYKEHSYLFDPYFGNHNLTIFNNYKDNLVFLIPLNPKDGLGNKLKAMIGSLSLNKQTKVQCSKDLCYSDFESILPSQYLYDVRKDTHCISYYTSRLPVLKREEKGQKNLVNEFSKHWCDLKELNYLISNHYIDWYYDPTQLSNEVKNRILHSLHSLQFLPYIYTTIEDLIRTFTDIKTSLSVAIRTWHASHESSINRTYFATDYKKQISSVLDTHPEITDVLIMIDNKEYLSEYGECFDQMVKSGRKVHFCENQNWTDLAYALIQVLLASKCTYLIGNRISSFTELIYWYSDLKIIPYLLY